MTKDWSKMTDKDFDAYMEEVDRPPRGAISGQQNRATNTHSPFQTRDNMTTADNHYAEGNKRTLDAMRAHNADNKYSENTQRALEALRAHNAKTNGPQFAHPQDEMSMGGPLTSNALGKQVDGGHYKDLKIQPIEYIHANNIPFAEGNIIKYVTRWRAKGGIKDLEKAKHFIELLIELEARK